MKTDKLDLTTPDLVNQNIEKIAALFPNCVTETAEGKAIDFDLLKQELNHEVVEGAKERYRLEWPGKKTGDCNCQFTYHQNTTPSTGRFCRF